MEFKSNTCLERTIELLVSPKEELEKLKGKELEATIGRMLNDEKSRKRYKIFFNNEYYRS